MVGLESSKFVNILKPGLYGHTNNFQGETWVSLFSPLWGDYATTKQYPLCTNGWQKHFLTHQM